MATITTASGSYLQHTYACTTVLLSPEIMRYIETHLYGAKQ